MLRVLGIVALTPLFLVAGLIAFLAIERRIPVTLPAPTGPFAVGRTIADWRNAAVVDPLASGANHEVLAWIWYPAVGDKSRTEAYWPASLQPKTPIAPPHWIIRLITRAHARVHSATDAAVSPARTSYPVLILRGGASAGVLAYSTLAADLASHGYVVVGIDAPYRTGRVVFPDGRVIDEPSANNPELAFGSADSARLVNALMAAWTGDMAFALDHLRELNATDSSGRFRGRLDVDRVGVFGHSFGGAQAAQFCSQDARCTAGVDIDGAPLGAVVHDGIPRPFLFLLTNHGSDVDSRRIMGNVQSIYDRLPANGRLRAKIRGAHHFMFTDDGAVLKSRALRGLLRALGKIDIDGGRQLAVSAYCLRVFFDAYVKGAGASPPRLGAAEYPEIKVF